MMMVVPEASTAGDAARAESAPFFFCPLIVGSV
jgi:hypothetical protein